MVKYYVIAGLLAIVAIFTIVVDACQHYSCNNYFANIHLFESKDPMAKYKDMLTNSRFAKMSVNDIAERVPETQRCELYRRAIQNVGLGGGPETSEKKVEAVLIYEVAAGRKCTQDQ
ncbi:MAG: hypothetical protein HY849_08885 [Nitrosomonadales bacterium]|nr:hypothetical protein [Nitrosomonadales bacterium]